MNLIHNDINENKFTSFTKYLLKSNQIEKQDSDIIYPYNNKNKSKPTTSIFNKLAANPSRKSFGEFETENPKRLINNKSQNPCNLRTIQNNSIFQTTVDNTCVPSTSKDDTKKFTKFNSFGKINNISNTRIGNDESSISNSNYPSSNGNKTKVNLNKYSHVFGDLEEKLNGTTKFDTTRSAASTRAGRFGSNKGLLSVKASNTETDEVKSVKPDKSKKKLTSLFNVPFCKILIV